VAVSRLNDGAACSTAAIAVVADAGRFVMRLAGRCRGHSFCRFRSLRAMSGASIDAQSAQPDGTMVNAPLRTGLQGKRLCRRRFYGERFGPTKAQLTIERAAFLRNSRFFLHLGAAAVGCAKLWKRCLCESGNHHKGSIQ
jgi:hypothetical protein